jgi:hypothetical protein
VDGLRVRGALVHGVASSWAAMVSSMLASPQGASEQYMWMDTSSRIVKGWEKSELLSGDVFWRKSEGGYGGVEMRWHSSRRKRLNARTAIISACQSCRMFPWARCSLLEGRHFIPVLGMSVEDSL